MTLLSSSHRSMIKVFPLSLTLQGMNKIECFLMPEKKYFFLWIHWCGKVFSNWIFKFLFLNSSIIWLNNGGKIVMAQIYIYIYFWVHLWEEQFRWTDEWVQFSVFLSPAIHEVTPWSYHNQLCSPQFRINSLIKCSLHSLKSFSPPKALFSDMH